MGSKLQTPGPINIPVDADTSDAEAAFAALKAKADDLMGSVGNLRSQMATLKGAAGDSASGVNSLKDAAGGSSASIGSLGRVAKLGGGELGAMGGKAGRLMNLLGKTGVAGAAVIAAVAFIAIGIAVAKATVEIAKWAIGLADANRNASLTEAGIEASSAALKGLGAVLPGIESATGLAADKIQGMAEQLAKAGIGAAALPGALKALATATAGGATADYLEHLKVLLAQGGAAAKQAAADVQKSFGGIVAQKLLSLDSQAAKFHANIAALFGGLKIEGFLEGLSKLVGLFDANSASGKAMKFIFEAMFQPLIDGATNAIPKLVQGFKQAEIAVLKLYIAILKSPIALGALKLAAYSVLIAFGLLGAMAGLALVGIGIGLAILFAPLVLIVAAVLLVKMAFVALWNFVSKLTWHDIGEAIGFMLSLPLVPLFALYDAIGELWDYVSNIDWGAVGDSIINAFSAAWDWLSSIDLSSVGSDIIDGLVNGIIGAGGAVLSALTGIVGGAVDAVKGMLHINSPSKVFMKIGDAGIGGGLAAGIDNASGDVADSAGGMASGAIGAASKAGGGAGKRSSGGATVTFQAGAIVIKAEGGDAEGIAAAVRRGIHELFEQESLMGGGVPA